jgi:hypothetical protein
MAIEARNRLLRDWFTRIRTRQIALPRFQRFEAWGHTNVAQLFNTILQDLPVGAALVLEVGQEEPFISRPLKGAPETGERVTEHLLDGQQRLTALWRGLHNNYTDRTYFVYFKPDEGTGMPYYVSSIARWKKAGDQEPRPFWANRPKDQWEERMIPLDLFRPDLDSQRFRDWAKAAIPDTDEREKVSDQAAVIRDKFASFNLPFISLPVTTSKETALDVFIRMNTSAAPLSTYDIVVAQIEAAMGKSLHDLVAGIRQACPAIAHYYAPEELVLYANALLQGRAPINSTYMLKDFGTQVLDRWDDFLRGVLRTVEFLEQERLFDAARLPTDVVVPVLVALWAEAPQGLDAEGRARVILRKFLWRAFFTGRYENSTNSRALTDYLGLKALIAGTSQSQPPVFDEKLYPLPQPEELMAAGWPVRKDRLARAILALALRQGGIDLADGGAATRENLRRREYHHLFPVAYLTGKGVENERIYLSLNCALVTWRTNRNISDKEPERYLAERLDGTHVGEAEVAARLASHLIPYDDMIKGDYQAFLEARAALVHAAMTTLCS